MENQVIMYDWLVALVGYILGDQIFCNWESHCFMRVIHFSEDSRKQPSTT